MFSIDVSAHPSIGIAAATCSIYTVQKLLYYAADKHDNIILLKHAAMYNINPCKSFQWMIFQLQTLFITAM